MKADITAAGVLIVSGETELEKFALSKWMEGFDLGESVLSVSGDKVTGQPDDTGANNDD
jgi:Tfp pilus assembly major pilin PilA